MRIGVPRERKSGERRVALPPDAVRTLVADGHRLVVERGAGEGLFFADYEYESAGAELTQEREAWQCELIVEVKWPVGDEPDRLGPNQMLFAFLHLAADPQLERRLRRSGATAIAYELVRSRAGRFPILEPMSQIAGGLAGQAAAHYLLAPSGGRGVLAGSVGGVDAADVVIVGECVAAMNAGSVLVDVAIDPGGCFETSRPTTHAQPTYVVEDVVHYCVANMPAAAPRTASLTLASSSLGYVRLLAAGGDQVLDASPELAAAAVGHRGREGPTTPGSPGHAGIVEPAEAS